MSSLGQRLFSAVLKTEKIDQYLKLGLREELFKPAELQAFLFIDNHVKKYNTLPALDTFNENVQIELVDVGKESPKFFADELRKRYLTDELKTVMLKAKNVLIDVVDPEQALELLLSRGIALKFMKNTGHLVDMRDIRDMVITNYKSKYDDADTSAVMTGWASLDETSQGMMGGDLVSIVGRPAMGKTFLGLYTAEHAWATQQKSVLFVSMEMMVPVIANRLAAMHSHINLTHLMKGTLSTKSFNKMRDDLTEMKGFKTPFYLMDGNMTATVEDIWSTATQLGVDFVYVDGGYLLGHPNKYLDRFGRVAENTRLLKQLVATDLDIPVGVSWQFNRKAAKKKVEETGLEDIGFSDEIGQLSSLVLGLFEQDSIETIKRRRVDILKGRNGETGQFNIKWDFYRCDFSEAFDSPDEQMGFL